MTYSVGIAVVSSAHAALGAAIVELRKERGLSQVKLAEATGLHPTYISGVERGRRNPSWSVVLTIASALEIAASEVVARAETLQRQEARGPRIGRQTAKA